MNLKNVLTRLFGRRAHAPHLPYIPTPPQSNNASNRSIPGHAAGPQGTYTEIQSTIQTIAGSNITLGSENIILVDANGQAREISKQCSHVLSTGKLVTRIEEIGGICPFCQSSAMQRYQAGELTLEAAQLACLYDVASAATCQACGVHACTRHIRPVDTDQGILSLCQECHKALKKQLRKKSLVRALLAPITASEEVTE